jgi:hypothetical protein
VRTTLNSFVILALVLTSASCGYTLAGRGSFLPGYIKVIGIPEFTNATPYFEIERRFTQQVRTEFIGRGRYQVLPEETGVDAVLRGTITNMSIQPVNFNQNQQATRYVIIINTSIQFVDLKTGKTLWENPAMVFREEYDLPAESGAGDPTAFFGQSSNALDRVAANFARAIVGAILEAF